MKEEGTNECQQLSLNITIYKIHPVLYLSGYVALAHAQISMQIVTFLILHMGKMCIISAR